MPSPVPPPVVTPPAPVPKRAVAAARPAGDPSRPDKSDTSFEQMLKDARKQEAGQTPDPSARSTEPAAKTLRGSKARRGHQRTNVARHQQSDQPESADAATDAPESEKQPAPAVGQPATAAQTQLQLPESDRAEPPHEPPASPPQSETQPNPIQQQAQVQVIPPEAQASSPHAERGASPENPPSRPASSAPAQIEEVPPSPIPDKAPARGPEGDPESIAVPAANVLSADQPEPLSQSAAERTPETNLPAVEAQNRRPPRPVDSRTPVPTPTQRAEPAKPAVSTANPQPATSSADLAPRVLAPRESPTHADPRITARSSPAEIPPQETQADAAQTTDTRTRVSAQPDADQILPSLKEFFAQLMAADDPGASPAPAAKADEQSADSASAVTSPSDAVARHGATAQTKVQKEPVAAASSFAEVNHPRIITAIRSQLLPDGGTMQLRLDPPELGTITVRIDLRDGAVAAAFQTTNDQTTQLLSHSLGQLKHALESQGVSVEKLQVERTPQEHRAGTSPDDSQQHQDQSSQQQEQQRRELLRRMWRRLSGGADPLDVTA